MPVTRGPSMKPAVIIRWTRQTAPIRTTRSTWPPTQAGTAVGAMGIAAPRIAARTTEPDGHSFAGQNLGVAAISAREVAWTRRFSTACTLRFPGLLIVSHLGGVFAVCCNRRCSRQRSGPRSSASMASIMLRESEARGRKRQRKLSFQRLGIVRTLRIIISTS